LINDFRTALIVGSAHAIRMSSLY